MNFGEAIEHLKAGKRVAREGWNGKGMWLTLLKPGNGQGCPLGAVYGEHGLVIPVDPCIAMRTAGGTVQPGWLASQADMLASDWVLAWQA